MDKGAKGRRGELLFLCLSFTYYGQRGIGAKGRTRANISFKERVVKTSRKGAKRRRGELWRTFVPFPLFLSSLGKGAKGRTRANFFIIRMIWGQAGKGRRGELGRTFLIRRKIWRHAGRGKGAKGRTMYGEDIFGDIFVGDIRANFFIIRMIWGQAGKGRRGELGRTFLIRRKIWRHAGRGKGAKGRTRANLGEPKTT